MMEHESRLASLILQVDYSTPSDLKAEQAPPPEHLAAAVDVLAADPELSLWLDEGRRAESDAASALMGAAILLGPILEEIVQHRHASRNEEEEERRQKIRPIKPSRDEECL
ncbi:MAG: hypothetical protein ACK5DV_01825 [Planctomycetota bacterium]|jgi:hypothetical protein